MTVRDMREILMHFEDPKYDDFEIILFDYNNQRKLEWLEGTHAVSQQEKRVTFPVRVEPIDGVTMNERMKKLLKEIQNSK